MNIRHHHWTTDPINPDVRICSYCGQESAFDHACLTGKAWYNDHGGPAYVSDEVKCEVEEADDICSPDETYCNPRRTHGRNGRYSLPRLPQGVVSKVRDGR